MSRATTFAAATRLGFGVLGPLEVRDGQTLVQIPGRQERALLALLLTAPGRVFSVASIVEALWEADPPGRAAKTVQSYVSRLRQSLPRNGTETVVTRSPGYLAVVETDQVDAEHFKALAAAGHRTLAEGRPDEAAALLREALGLWRGEPYAEFDEPFAVAERTALEELRTTALEDRIEAELRAGAGTELVAELEALIARHPWRERLWVQLMVALYRARRQADSLDAYRRARRVLGEELGLEPGPELRETEARVLAQDQSLLGTQPLSADVLPPAGPTFVGRETQLARLLAAYEEAAAGTVVRVLVTGPHGIGKSRLLAELAQQAQSLGAVVRLGPSTPWPASDRPLVLLLDDLQRTAPGDLATLAKRIVAARPPLLVVGAAVLSEAPPDVRAVLAKAFPDQLSLPPLPRAAVEAVVRVYVGPDDVAEALAAVADADGVPLQVHAAASRYGEVRAATEVEEAAAGIPEPRRHLTASRDRVTDRVLDLQRIRLLREAHAPTEQPYVVCPYKGLAHYEPDDAPYYAGRDRLVAQLVARVVDARMLAVVGASGSGKSSAVGAGLIAAVRAGSLPGSDAWQTVLTRPTRARPEPTPEGTRALIVVDQLEELFTAVDGADRDEYVEWLVSEAGRPGTTVVVVVRSDFFPVLAADRRLAALVADDTVIVGEMTTEELRQAIERPATAAGLELEPGLVDRVLADAGDEPGALPLVSTALVSLWERRDGRRLTLAAYAEIGGVHSSIARLAESAYGRMTPEQQIVARRILLRLAATGEGGEPVRRRVPLDEVARDDAADARRVLDVLAASRLVTVSDAHAEVAHEALLRAWPRLADWLAEDEEGRRLRQHLSPAALDWAARGRDPDELYRGPRLTTALGWETDHPDDLTSLERDFLHTSRDAADAEALRRRQSIRRLRGLAVGLAAVLVLAVTAGVVAVDRRNDALAASLAADVRTLQALALDEERWDLALLYAAQAQRYDPSEDSRAALLQTVQRSPEATAVLYAEEPLKTLAVSPDGERIAAAGNLGTVYVWDTVSRERLQTIPGVTTMWATSLDFSPDGRQLAVVGLPHDIVEAGRVASHQVAVVDLEASPPSVRLFVQDPVVALSTARYAADGRLVALGADGRVRDLDTETGVLSASSTVPVAASETVVVDGPANRHFLTAADPERPGLVSAWDAEEERLLWSSTEPDPTVASISPDGSMLLLGHSDGRIEIVDLVGGGSRASLPTDSTDPITEAAWAPDGSTVATVTQERTVELWDAATLEPDRVLRGHWGPVTQVAYSPDGSTLYATSGSRGVLGWDLSGTTAVVTDGSRHDAADGYTIIAPDGSISATRHDDGRLEVTEEATGAAFEVRVPAATDEAFDAGMFFDPAGQRLGVMTFTPSARGDLWAHITVDVVDVEDRVVMPHSADMEAKIAYAAEFTPGGAALVTAGQTSIRRWDLDSAGEWPAFLHTAAAPVPALVVDPDGRHAALVGDGGDIEIIDVQTGEHVLTAPAARAGWTPSAGAFSPDGRWFAEGFEGGRLVVRDTETWQVSPSWEGVHGSVVETLAFTPDSRHLVAGGAGQASIWSLGTTAGRGAVIDVDLQHSGDTVQVLVVDDGSSVVTYTEATGLRRWTIDSGRLLEHACAVVARDLTQEEWEAVLPDRPYERTCPDAAAQAARMAP